MDAPWFEVQSGWVSRVYSTLRNLEDGPITTYVQWNTDLATALNEERIYAAEIKGRWFFFTAQTVTTSLAGTPATPGIDERKAKPIASNHLKHSLQHNVKLSLTTTFVPVYVCDRGTSRPWKYLLAAMRSCKSCCWASNQIVAASFLQTLLPSINLFSIDDSLNYRFWMA